jgi:hypothetical protein
VAALLPLRRSLEPGSPTSFLLADITPSADGGARADLLRRAYEPALGAPEMEQYGRGVRPCKSLAAQNGLKCADGCPRRFTDPSACSGPDQAGVRTLHHEAPLCEIDLPVPASCGQCPAVGAFNRLAALQVSCV